MKKLLTKLLQIGTSEEIAYGWGGIRTPGTFYRSHAFQACTIDHSVTHPSTSLSGENSDFRRTRRFCQSIIRILLQTTSTVICTSASTPLGNEPAPTAARACRPASPNKATSKSDAPLITAGTSVKSGAALT